VKVKIVTPQEMLFEAEATEVVLPGFDGELSVWDFHQSFFYALRPGRIKVKLRQLKDGKNEARLFIKRGFARMELNELMLLVEK
jgi:F0F1-type ATP synthase epsilon subunit